jgi:hypothetical protein
MKMFAGNFRLSNSMKFSKEIALDSSMFGPTDETKDFAILKFPREGFIMPRMPISYTGIFYTMKVHALGYVGHIEGLVASNGEVSNIQGSQFSITLISAPGFSGAAVISDGVGRAVGYMYGNWDASTQKNSQHQSLACKLDAVIDAMPRKPSPSSPPENFQNKSNKARKSMGKVETAKEDADEDDEEEEDADEDDKKEEDAEAGGQWLEGRERTSRRSKMGRGEKRKTKSERKLTTKVEYDFIKFSRRLNCSWIFFLNFNRLPV